MSIDDLCSWVQKNLFQDFWGILTGFIDDKICDLLVWMRKWTSLETNDAGTLVIFFFAIAKFSIMKV